MMRKGLTSAFLFVILLALIAVAYAAETRVVDTTSGKVQGIVANNAQQWLGIPYAQPPVNGLRWKEPVKAREWSGVLKTQAFADACWNSGPFSTGGLNQSENCLFLNVFAPTSADDKSRLPVRVWIHGGAYLSGGTVQYPSANLAATSQSIIVSIAYRLNVFGFLALPQLRKESTALNYGLLDQQFALQWVRDNIHQFGGDANNVMIFGESAGGGSVAMHLLMSKSNGLYHKAILESPGNWNYPTLDQALTFGLDAANNTPCANLRNDAEKQLTCLRDAPVSVFLQLPPQVLNMMIPAVDNNQIHDSPLKLFASGQFNKNVPVLIGTNAVEGNLFAYLFSLLYLNLTTMQLNEQQYDFLYSSQLGAVGQMVKPYYAAFAKSNGYFAAFSQVLGDFYVTCGAAIVADATVKGRDGQREGVYRYVFEQRTSSGIVASLNATHGMELPYVFNDPQVFNNGTSFTAEEQSVADTIVQYWTEFHRWGNPNGRAVGETWPRYLGNNTTTGDIKLLKYGFKESVPQWDAGFCKLWSSILLK